MRLRLLDLYCGAGGCARGYTLAGFDVHGVDNVYQPRYRKSGAVRFIWDDALEYVWEHGEEYDVIHASPPCQAYSPLRFLHPDKSYPDLLGATRDVLIGTGKPWVIENVMSAPLIGGIALCGSMFGLRTYRHRRFESSLPLRQPRHPQHEVETVYTQRSSGWAEGKHVSVVGNIGTKIASVAMGIDWMTSKELAQAIPPSYTKYIGEEILRILDEQSTARAAKEGVLNGLTP